MFKVLTSGKSLQEALDNAQKHAVESLSVDGEVPAFQQVNVELATSAPVDGETVRYAGSVTFQVMFPPFGVQVDHEGTVTAVHLAEVKGLRFEGRDLAVIKAELETPVDSPVKDLPVDLPVKGGRL